MGSLNTSNCIGTLHKRQGTPYADRVHSRLNRLLRDLNAIPDPQDRAKAYSDVLGSVPEFQSQLRQQRQDLLTELYEAGMSYGRIAAITGITRARVKQVIDGERASGKLRKTAAGDGDGNGSPAEA
jgi:DNA-directed RNA polymerase specialized sigma24 family protein